MTNEQIRAACERAEGITASVKSDMFQTAAFAQILGHLLAEGSSKGFVAEQAEHREARKSESKIRSRPEGLKARLVNLQAAGFFTAPQDVKAVAKELSNLGWNHQPKEISARLIELTRNKVLRRSGNSDGGYLYSNW